MRKISLLNIDNYLMVIPLGTPAPSQNLLRIKKWLLKIGRERASFWRAITRSQGIDPFSNMIYKAFLAGGLGHAYATKILSDLAFRASRANVDLYTYLSRLHDQGQLNQLLRSLGAGNNEILAANSILNISLRL